MLGGESHGARQPSLAHRPFFFPSCPKYKNDYISRGKRPIQVQGVSNKEQDEEHKEKRLKNDAQNQNQKEKRRGIVPI